MATVTMPAMAELEITVEDEVLTLRQVSASYSVSRVVIPLPMLDTVGKLIAEMVLKSREAAAVNTPPAEGPTE